MITECLLSLMNQLLKKNTSKRNFYKLAANALFGKIAQRNDFKKTVYVSSQDELENLYFGAHEITEITCLNDLICQVTLKPLTKDLPPNRTSNCYLGAQVTAYARETMHRHINSLISKSNAILYYVDCDCLIFSLPKLEACPVLISNKCGDFKHEYSNIENFLTLGIKSYFLSYQDQEQPKQVCKIKGLSLGYTGKSFDEKLFDSYIEAFLLNETITTSVRQQHRIADFKKFQTFVVEKNVAFSNKITSTRILQRDTRVSSVPYGYKNGV